MEVGVARIAFLPKMAKIVGMVVANGCVCSVVDRVDAESHDRAVSEHVAPAPYERDGNHVEREKHAGVRKKGVLQSRLHVVSLHLSDDMLVPGSHVVYPREVRKEKDK